jgi:hypothetical protein
MAVYPPPVMITVYAVFTTIGIALTCLRFWIRLSFARTPIGIDDMFIVLGTVVMTVVSGIQIYNAAQGAGGNAIVGSTSVAVIEHSTEFMELTIEKIGFGAIKLSLLFFFRRIFGVSRSFKWINNTSIVLVTVWAVSFLLLHFFICGLHPEYYWAVDQEFTREHCLDLGA